MDKEDKPEPKRLIRRNLYGIIDHFFWSAFGVTDLVHF